MKKHELQAVLRSWNLPVSGRKDDLKQRILFRHPELFTDDEIETLHEGHEKSVGVPPASNFHRSDIAHESSALSVNGAVKKAPPPQQLTIHESQAMVQTCINEDNEAQQASSRNDNQWVNKGQLNQSFAAPANNEWLISSNYGTNTKPTNPFHMNSNDGWLINPTSNRQVSQTKANDDEWLISKQ